MLMKYLIQNSQAVKISVQPQEGHCEKRNPRWRPRNGSDGRIMTTQVNLVPNPSEI